ncbi:hypothetical protein [Methylocystis echinoides]|uniref:Uncharacterized protein n=1 Tax=Methylocystis echinoides TaxID=29468 RepID=A0A9W6LSK1_9HYPH|nr:hypothetical protein [Methylocystis echinoides]GLI93668.1 hypothetical protein LMG27198_26600 [Methylocystis echinoides]
MFGKFFANSPAAAQAPAVPQGASQPGITWSAAEGWETLPPPAREKFLALRDEAEDAHAALEPLRLQIDEIRIDRLKAESRVSRIERETLERLNGEQPGLAAERERVGRLSAEMDRLQARYDARAAAWRAKRLTVSAIEDYYRQAGGPFSLAAPIPTPAPAKGEGLLDLIGRLRQKIAALREQRQAVLDAPVPSADAKRLAIAQIEALAARPASSG